MTEDELVTVLKHCSPDTYIIFLNKHYFLIIVYYHALSKYYINYLYNRNSHEIYQHLCNKSHAKFTQCLNFCFWAPHFNTKFSCYNFYSKTCVSNLMHFIKKMIKRIIKRCVSLVGDLLDKCWWVLWVFLL